MTYVMKLPTFCWPYQNLPEPLSLLKAAIYYSLSSTLYKVGALLIIWYSTPVKLKLYPSPGKLTYLSMIINFVNPP
jgi:hypothetical protein